LLLHRLLARRTLVEKSHHVGLPVVVWTVDDARWVERARLLGLYALITNQPAKLLAVI
jgi:glycerophosphoryl diester phosphodiesterase